jgi:hypothetical protein
MLDYCLIFQTIWAKFYIIPLNSPLNYIKNIFSPLLILAEAPPLVWRTWMVMEEERVQGLL